MLVTSDRGGDPYRNLIESREPDVLFVAINGYPFYGTYNLMRAARAAYAEPITVGRHRRRIVLIYPGIKDADLGWAEALADIAKATADPVARYLEIEQLHRARQATPMAANRQTVGQPRDHRPARPCHRPNPAARSAHPQPPLLRRHQNSPLHGGLLDRLRADHLAG